MNSLGNDVEVDKKVIENIYKEWNSVTEEFDIENERLRKRGTAIFTITDRFVPIGVVVEYQVTREEEEVYVEEADLTTEEAEGIDNLQTRTTGTSYKQIERTETETKEYSRASGKIGFTR